MVKHRLWSTVLFLGFGVYLLMCIALQIGLFKQYASGLHGAAHINLIPFMSLSGAWISSIHGMQMPFWMWSELAALMIPFGFGLFLWVEDCTSFRSIASITLGFSGILCATNYLLAAPVFNIDFILASLCGAYAGYGIAILFIEVLFGNPMKAMLGPSPKTYRKAV